MGLAAQCLEERVWRGVFRNCPCWYLDGYDVMIDPRFPVLHVGDLG